MRAAAERTEAVVRILNESGGGIGFNFGFELGRDAERPALKRMCLLVE